MDVLFQQFREADKDSIFFNEVKYMREHIHWLLSGKEEDIKLQ